MQLTFLSPDLIQVEEQNPLKEMSVEEYERLKNSIAEVGILNPPLVEQVTLSNGDFEYHILEGRHRLKVAKELGIKLIPCMVITDPDPLKKLSAIYDTELCRKFYDQDSINHFLEAKSQKLSKQKTFYLSRLLSSLPDNIKEKLKIDFDINSSQKLTKAVSYLQTLIGSEQEEVDEKLQNYENEIEDLSEQLRAKNQELKETKELLAVKEENFKKFVNERIEEIVKQRLEEEKKRMQDYASSQTEEELKQLEDKIRKEEVQKLKEEYDNTVLNPLKKELEEKTQLLVELSQKYNKQVQELSKVKAELTTYQAQLKEAKEEIQQYKEFVKKREAVFEKLSLTTVLKNKMDIILKELDNTQQRIDNLMEELDSIHIQLLSMADFSYPEDEKKEYEEIISKLSLIINKAESVKALLQDKTYKKEQEVPPFVEL